MAVVTLNKRTDSSFAYSLFCQIVSKPWQGDPPEEGSTLALFTAHKSIEDSLAHPSGLELQVARLRAFSSHSTGSSSPPSLLEVMQALPNPCTLGEVLPLEALLALARTSRSWWAQVMGHELPELLRRLLSRADSAPLHPFSWRNANKSLREWSTSFSFRQVTTVSSLAPQDELLPPLAECPPLLEWMIDQTADLQTTVDAAQLVKGWCHFASIALPDCPRDDIQRLLHLAMSLATTTATRKTVLYGTEFKLVAFSIPSIALAEIEGGGGADVLELLWVAEYTCPPDHVYPDDSF
jgi:hypothetical protein